LSKPRRIRNKVDGWIVLDKPIGITSTTAVSVVKRLFQAEKAGHAGTLDPLASGLLPLAFGEATKTVPFVMDGEKAYRFTVTWGAETETDDSDGKVVRESPLRPTAEAIEALLPRFIGEIDQMPPTYSALKINGERAYDLARDGEEVRLETRRVIIHALSLAEHHGNASVFLTECGKGTYVRSLARDLGRLLGCFGHISQLRRTRVGPFREVDSVPLAGLKEAGEGGPEAPELKAALMPVETALADVPHVAVSGHDAGRLRNGQPIILRGRDAPVLSGIAYATFQGKLIALVEGDAGQLHPRRTFNLP
jgi:tRNA pseudouridine55 synthase